MGKSVLFNMRMDEELKKEVEVVCKEMGITMTAAFTMLAKKISREKRLPFPVECISSDIDAYKFIEDLQGKLPQVRYPGGKNEIEVSLPEGRFLIEVHKLD